MERIVINTFGRGLDTTRNPTLIQPGYARVSRNLLHNRGENRAELRAGIDRVWATRWSNNPVYGLFEYINTSGTITRLAQVNGSLRSFTLTPTDTPVEIDAGHQTTGIARFSQFLGVWVEADNGSANYIGNGTNGYPFQIVAPTSTHTVVDNGGGVLVGTLRYDYARFSSITGEISPAFGTAVSLASSSRQNRVSVSIATSEQFDQIRFYRTRAGGTQYYELATVAISAGTATYDDNIADSGLTTVSPIHTSAGASNTDRPGAAVDVVQHRGRVHLVMNASSRHRWSGLNNFSFDSTTTARHDVEVDDGDYLRRAISYDGALVLFKDNSIHLKNGDVDELSFTWQIVSNKSAGIGSYCPHTVVATPIGIIFLSSCGVYLYRPGMRGPERISDNIQDTLDSLDYSRRLFFTADYDPCMRAYLLSVTPSGQTTNTETYVYFIDTGAWGQFIYGMGNIHPSNWALMHNGSTEMKVYVGETEGYVYETETSNNSDGVTSGTEAGTATGGTATTLVDSGAAFRTTGDGLTDLSATIQTGTGTYESQEISSNTGTELTTSTWTTTPSTQSYWVGAIEGILSLGRIDAGTAGYKRFIRINFEFQSQTHSIPLLLGFTMDGDTQPTAVSSVTQTGIFRASILVNRIGVGISPYIRTVGNDNQFEILKIEVDYHDLANRLPRT